MKEIIFYRTKEGKCPIEDFLETLTDKQARKVAWVLRAIRDIDPIPSQYLKKMVNTDDIWEVRVSIGNNIFRFLGFFEDKKLFVLTNSFQKKSQKTPRNEIKLAEERKKEYKNRRKEHG